MEFLTVSKEKSSSLKVHEWLAVAIVTGIILGLACLTSFKGRGEASKLPASLIAKQYSGFDVLIKGAVGQPGIYHLQSEIKMKDLLAIAEVSSKADLRRFGLDSMIKKGRIINVPSRPMINVRLKGAVINDRVVEIPKNSKLEDLIEIGGFTAEADLNFLKKKRRLKAEEIIHVPSLCDKQSR